MATDIEKKQNLIRLSNLSLAGVTKGVWDFVGESSLALSHSIGATIIRTMEKEMGLEISGENPKDVLQEISRIFVDEFGFASDIEVEENEQSYVLRVNYCVNRKLTDQLAAEGVEIPFICPAMNAAIAALDRMKIRVRHSVKKNSEKKGSIITLEKMDAD